MKQRRGNEETRGGAGEGADVTRLILLRQLRLFQQKKFSSGKVTRTGDLMQGQVKDRKSRCEGPRETSRQGNKKQGKVYFTASALQKASAPRLQRGDATRIMRRRAQAGRFIPRARPMLVSCTEGFQLSIIAE